MYTVEPDGLKELFISGQNPSSHHQEDNGTGQTHELPFFCRLWHPNHASVVFHVLVFAICLVLVYNSHKGFVLACTPLALRLVSVEILCHCFQHI
jgi:hypothetical protein